MTCRAAATLGLLALMVAAASAQAPLRTRTFASGFTAPVLFLQDPTNRAVQFVVEQGGRIRVLQDGVVLPTDFLDLRSAISSGGERGLLGMAIPGDGSGRVFVNFTNPSGHTVVARFKRSANPAVADPASRFDLRWGGGDGSSPSRTPITTAATWCSGRTATCTSAWATAGRATIPSTARRTSRSCSARCCVWT